MVNTVEATGSDTRCESFPAGILEHLDEARSLEATCTREAFLPVPRQTG